MRYFSLLFLLSIMTASTGCGLLNSGTAHIKYTIAEAEFEGRQYENTDRLGNLSFSVRNVQHPRKHGKWDFNVRLTPSIHYDDTTYGTLETKLNSQGQVVRYPDINVRRLISFGNIKFSTHTPIGAFVLTGGFGGTVYNQTDNEGLDTYKTREIRRIDFAWVGFLSKRFFLLAGPRFYKEAYESYVFAFRIGYFWGKI